MRLVDDGMPRPLLLVGNSDDHAVQARLYFRVQAGYGFPAMLGFLQGKISERNGAMQRSGGPRDCSQEIDGLKMPQRERACTTRTVFRTVTH